MAWMDHLVYSLCCEGYLKGDRWLFWLCRVGWKGFEVNGLG